MINLLKIAVFSILMMAGTTAVSANTYPTVQSDEGKTLVLNLNDWKNENLKVVIKDLSSEILHEDILNKGEAASRKYNLKNLPNGTYELILEGDAKKAFYEIEVRDQMVEINAEKSNIVFKPFIQLVKDHVTVSQLALGSEVTVSMQDKNGEFFSETYQDELSLNKRFNIAELPFGDYTVVVSGKNFYSTFDFAK